MSNSTLIIALLVLLAVGGVAVIAFILLGSKSSNSKLGNVKALMSKAGEGNADREMKMNLSKPNELNDRTSDIIMKQAVKKRKPTAAEDLQKKLFRAGLYSIEDRAWFTKVRIIVFILSILVLPATVYYISPTPLMMMLGGLIGLIVGFAAPMSWLESKIRAREEDIMYFLPLVIEQISIGVSSSLDIGPCISYLVAMSEERGSHNPVTEMFVSVEKLIRAGLNLEQALLEVAEVFGILELKHTFMFLSQCSKHGGELSKQLQELADSVTTQRQVYVEGKITALPVKATGPLVTIFAGFFALLFSGLMVKLMEGFGGQ